MAAVSDDDEEALTWGTERDTTHVESPVVPDVDPADEDDDEEEEEEPKSSSGNSALLVVYGIFAGIFLVYVVGWVIAIQSIDTAGAGSFALILDRVGQFLAFLSPVIWFFGVLLLVPATRARTRILWLVLGVLVLAPWPFVLGY